jgi:hypothetical protein
LLEARWRLTPLRDPSLRSGWRTDGLIVDQRNQTSISDH